MRIWMSPRLPRDSSVHYNWGSATLWDLNHLDPLILNSSCALESWEGSGTLFFQMLMPRRCLTNGSLDIPVFLRARVESRSLDHQPLTRKGTRHIPLGDFQMTQSPTQWTPTSLPPPSFFRIARGETGGIMELESRGATQKLGIVFCHRSPWSHANKVRPF